MDKAHGNRNDTFNPGQIWAELKRRKWLALTIVILGVAATVAYTALQPVLYRSTASVLIENFIPSTKGFDNPYPDMSIGPDVMKAQRSLAESQHVRDGTREAARQKLGEAPDAPEVDYQAQTDGQLLYLNVLDTSPKRAADYANQWAETFCEYMRRRSSDPATRIVEEYEKVVPKLRLAWLAALQARNTFEKNHHFDPKDFERNPIHERIRTLNQDALALSKQLIEMQKNQEWIKDIKPLTLEAVIALPGAKEDPFLIAAKAEVNAWQSKLNEGLLSKKRDSPEVRDMQLNLTAANQALDAAIAGFMVRFDGQVMVLQNRYKAVVAELEEAEKAKRGMVELSWEWQQLDQAEKDAEQAYSERSHEKSTADFSRPFVGAYAKPWEVAIEPRLPALPNWRRNIAAGILFSAILTALLIVLLDRLDDSVRTINDLPHKPGFAALGMIPASVLNLDEGVLYKIVDERSFSTIAEALRNLHISLEVKYDNRRLGKPLVLTVTSALANEGKTMVSSNLALLFASLGRKTLLVDADLRKQSLSKTYGHFSPGLSEYMEGAAFKPEAVMSLGHSNLFLLPAGALENDAPSTFKPEAFNRLLSEMMTSFEVIIFDTPPVLPMADACIMGHASDATVLVVRSRRTTLRQLDSAIAKLDEAKVKEVQCIVNGVEDADTYGYPSQEIYGYGLSDRAAETTKQPRMASMGKK